MKATKAPSFKPKQQVFFLVFCPASPHDLSHMTIRQGKLLRFNSSQVVKEQIVEYVDQKKWFHTEKVEVHREENKFLPAKYWVEYEGSVYTLDRIFSTKQDLINSL